MVKIFIWGVLLYSVYCGMLFLLQRQMMFPRGLIETPNSDPQVSGLEQIWIKTSFGRVEAWFLPPAPAPAAGPAPAIIFAHGNGELIDFWPDELKRFNRMGVGVLLVEYPGYGRSGGAPTQRSIEETFVVAYDELAARKDVDSARIVLFGRSLGGGAMCLLAARRPSAALILMSTFTSARSFAARYLAPAFLVRDPFDNLAAVKTYSGPVLVMHGRFDEVIPYRHAETLHRAARHGKMVSYESGHNDCPPDWEVFWKDVAAFLEEINVIED